MTCSASPLRGAVANGISLFGSHSTVTRLGRRNWYTKPHDEEDVSHTNEGILRNLHCDCVCLSPPTRKSTAGRADSGHPQQRSGIAESTASPKAAAVDTRDQRGTTLLMHAAAIGSPDAVKLLLDSGADVNAKNEVGGHRSDSGRGRILKRRACWWKKART